MHYLFGDSTPSRLTTNFLEFLKSAIDFCVTALHTDERIRQGQAKAVRLATAWSSELRQPGAEIDVAPVVLHGAATAQRVNAPSALTTEVTTPARRLDELVLTESKRIEIQNITGQRAFPGKDIGKAEEKKFTPVAPGSYNSAAIIMLTDGQRTTGPDPLDAAKMAAEAA